MLEPEMGNIYADPPLDSPRPSSKTRLGISHVLASVFKDFYTKDITRGSLSDRSKPESGGSSHQSRYVEELQQIRSDYNKSIKEADMLESHIIQAKIRAEAAEKEAYERIKENMGNASDDLGQFEFLVKSAFTWCVDSSLLQQHNLISPRDYLPVQNPHVERPAAVRQDPARHDASYSTCLPLDDGYNQISSLEPMASDFSLTCESSSEKEKRKKTPKKSKQSKPRPTPRDEQSAQDWMEAQEKMRMLKDRHNFLPNPRFLPLNTPHGATSLVKPRNKAANVTNESSSEAPVPVFLAEPATLLFSDYTVGRVYEATLELKNVTSASQHVRVIPPATSFFSMGLGRFPGDGGMVAPGMSCKYTIRFAPDSLGDYEDCVTVEMQMEKLVVPIVAKRPPPVLTLPKTLDCGYCLIGGVKFVQFQCKNVGLSGGSFCIIPKGQWPVSNLRSVARTQFSEQAPFAVSPSLFNLQSGDTVVVEVVFFPTAAERSSRDFTVVCDNCQVKEITVEGEGQLIAVKFILASEKTERPSLAEARDLTAQHFVRFSPCNPHSVQQEKFIVRNNTHVELPFHWRIMKPNLRYLLPGETPEPSYIRFHQATDDAFQVRPPAGVLAPCQDEEFLLTFNPKELRDYHSVCHLVLNDVPQPRPQPLDLSCSSLQPLQAGTKVSDVVALEIEVKGSTEPYQVLLEPNAVVIPGEIFISKETRRSFMMWNHSRTCVSFQWERTCSSSHIIEIEPPTGRIEVNEHFDFNLVVTGLKPVRVETSVVCRIRHHAKPVSLAVMVKFKGPIVTPSIPSIDFGLMELGRRAQTSLILTNITPLKATWALKEREGHKDSPISVWPRRGVLRPSASCSVDVAFTPRLCQEYDTELQLAVVDGQDFRLWVRAVVQSPQVCLLNCQLLLSELYLGVPTTATVTLFNQTLLPSHFRWRSQLEGNLSGLCMATFDPSSGTLEPNSRMEITVTFISHTDLELKEVTALCDIQGMISPLALHLVASKPKKLSVKYSLPNTSKSLQAVSLDFGDNVKLESAVTKQLLITNQTAIPAPFTIEVQYFSCGASKSKEQLERRCSPAPLRSIRTKKTEERAQSEFVSHLLAHGRGAAFYVSPHSGMLGPFETKAVDVTVYTDMWGEYTDFLICKVGELEDTLIPMQVKVKGCPIYFQITGPQPNDQNRGPTLRFGTHICGGDTVSRCLRINNPTMFDIRLDWETYNINVDERPPVGEPRDAPSPQPVDDGEAASMSVESLQGSPEGDASPGAEGTDASPPEDGEGKEGSPSPRQERAHVATMSDYPYCVTPQQTVIPARGSNNIHASFTPLTLSELGSETRCVGMALGFLSLPNELDLCVPEKVVRTQGVDLEPVRLDLLAVVKPPVLSVLMEDDEGTLEFRASASDLVKGRLQREMPLGDFDVKQALRLTNNVGATLHFRLGTLPPFSLVEPRHLLQTSSSSHPSSAGQYLVLPPHHRVQVNVVFHCTPALLDYAEQAGEDLPAGVSLIQCENGQKRLMFQQNLLIQYSNHSQQSVPLCAHLSLPAMALSTDRIHFGVCFVGQTLTRGVSLNSRGGRTSWTSTIESRDSDAFGVAPSFGFLGSKDARTIQVSFTPSGEREFRATLVILSPLLKTTLTLQLQGTGSFNEVHRKDHLT
ncbi:Deleted in lung and esophageal cancer protein 1 [Takifugu flavidus]|uniref:Deleted in lung and esophageal cancer protein 1 n=1 Tax=Takifugu flavidus TaxID=433684 RepID=A0A5C6NYF0_9TELE|nr:Deleted in lung and esophageal cancer protein 1 [Takifugu flavidus]